MKGLQNTTQMVAALVTVQSGTRRVEMFGHKLYMDSVFSLLCLFDALHMLLTLCTCYRVIKGCWGL
jgi:hypothetical protein